MAEAAHEPQREPQRRGGAEAGGKGAEALRRAVEANDEAHAAELTTVVESLRAGGATSLRALAEGLNACGIFTRRGGRWHVSNVRDLVLRLERHFGGSLHAHHGH